MAISVNDLDQLLGYDAATHSVAGIPSMQPVSAIKPASAASTMPSMERARLETDVARERANPSLIAPAIPKAAAPVGIPAAAPEISSPEAAPALNVGIPALARPTPQQSIATGMAEHGDTAKQEGKRQYEEGLPQVTAPPLTSEYYQQQRAVSDYKREHPLGGDISAKPGFWGKLEHGLARAGNIAGDVFAPNAMMMIPGTDLNNAIQRSGQLRGFNAAVENEQRQAETNKINQETEAAGKWQPMGNPVQDPNTGAWFQAGKGKDASGAEVTSWQPLEGGPSGKPVDEMKQVIGDQGVQQQSQQLATMTEGMSADEAKKFSDAYAARPTDTLAVARQRMEDAKGVAQMSGAERDRAIARAATAAQQSETNRLKEEQLAAERDKAGAGGTDVVRAFDKDGVPHLTSEADAKAQGYNKITKATDKDINDARTHNVVLNDMQAKLNDVVTSSKALDQNEAQRAIIAKSLSDNKNTTFNALLTSGALSQASDETKDYVQSVLSLRESALGLPKEITGGSRVSEVQASALWSTLPSAGSLDSKYALTQAKKFQANIDRLWQRVDSVEGMTHEKPAAELGSKAAFKVPNDAPSAKGVADGKVLRDGSGNVLAVAKGGAWTAP